MSGNTRSGRPNEVPIQSQSINRRRVRRRSPTPNRGDQTAVRDLPEGPVPVRQTKSRVPREVRA